MNMSLFASINWAVIAPLVVIQFILMGVALIDLLRNEQPNGPKWMWMLIVIFGQILGPVAYFIFGKGDE